MRPHVSYSELASFATECKWKWKLDYLEGRRSSAYSVHFDFGTSIHEGLELHLTRKSPISVDDAVKHFREKFSSLYAKNGDKYDKKVSQKDIDGLLVSGENILRHLDDCQELKGAEVVHNEYPLFEDIQREDGVEVKFKGFIDIVLKSKDKRDNTILYICDFKTCSWGWSGEDRQNRWKHYQLFLYKYFLCKKFNIDPKNVRTAFILLKKKPAAGVSPIEFFPVSAGPVSVQRSLDVLNSTITEMAAHDKDGDFEKNRDCCKNKYGNVCPYYNTDLCPNEK